ncbi:MAG: hypothetical protein LBC30_01935 [Puniceicoccales bacterium]|jgi:hypothetical protein|nr:hypothetical protein [Puniceicoccales bacterium]
MDNVTNALNGTQFTESVTSAWNTFIKPALGNYLNQTGGIIPTDIIDRNADTLGECVKQASRLAKPLSSFLANKAIDFGKSTWSLAAAHPYAAVALVIVMAVIPAIREYRAAGGRRGILRAVPVVSWMIITRPFRLAWRIVTVITGRTEVDKQRFGAAQKTIAQFKQLHPILRADLNTKQTAVTAAINGVTDNNTKIALTVATNQIFSAANAVHIPNNFFEQQDVQWKYLQLLVTSQPANANIPAVKRALDDWKKTLDLCIVTS